MATDVYQRLLNDIVLGQYQAGDPLIELQLADKYGVSRTPVREALRRLESDGLVEQSSRGFQIRRHTPSDILDIYDVRISLEQTAARTAAERHTAFDLAKIRHAQDVVRATDPTDIVKSSAASHAFHEAVWDASHNETLISMLLSLKRRIATFSSSTLEHPGRSEASSKEHEGIVDAIEARSPQLAGELAAEHMTVARDVRVRLYTQGSSI